MRKSQNFIIPLVCVSLKYLHLSMLITVGPISATYLWRLSVQQILTSLFYHKNQFIRARLVGQFWVIWSSFIFSTKMRLELYRYEHRSALFPLAWSTRTVVGGGAQQQPATRGGAPLLGTRVLPQDVNQVPLRQRGNRRLTRNESRYHSGMTCIVIGKRRPIDMSMFFLQIIETDVLTAQLSTIYRV